MYDNERAVLLYKLDLKPTFYAIWRYEDGKQWTSSMDILSERNERVNANDNYWDQEIQKGTWTSSCLTY